MSEHETKDFKVRKYIRNQTDEKDEIKSLDLSGQKLDFFSLNMKEEMESCINLETLTLCECDLVNLDNLPELPKLRELDLSSNLIPDAELKKLLQYRKLQFLSLAENHIVKLESVTALESLTELERAEFLDNEIEGLPDYFKLIFETFPKLQYLDNKDREGNDVELDNEDDILAGSLNSDNMEFPEDEKGDDYDDEEDDDEDYEEDDEEEENQENGEKGENGEELINYYQKENESDEEEEPNLDEGSESEDSTG